MNIPEAIAEIQQSRSQYQIEHFVLGQHNTPEMRFYQLCIELQDMEYKLAHATLHVRRKEVELERLRSSTDELDMIDAEVKELELKQTKLVMIGAEREISCLRDLFNTMPHFTRYEIEQSQPEYWSNRLTRQAELQIAQSQTGIGWANLDALDQAGVEWRTPEQSPAEIGNT